METLEDRTVPNTYMVTSTADSGAGTLRQAITDSNNHAGANVIQFNISGSGVHTIQPTSALPQITDAVTIDGTSQPGYSTTPLIEINGASAGSFVDGLDISAGNSTVKGLAINGFNGSGISIFTNGGDVVTGCFLGTNAAGTAAKANGGSGTLVQSANNTIGGTTSATRNILSGNTFFGIQITGSGATGNVVIGNYIGVDVTGGVALGNLSVGVLVNGGANGNTIGGTAAGDLNVASGNTFFGIQVADAGTKNNTVEGNFVGTDATGTKAIANASEGIVVNNGAQSNTIGGTSASAMNLVSGNKFSGIQVADANTNNNTVEGNFVGTDVTGSKALANGSDGILVNNGAQSNTIGGTTSGARNIVSGNVASGIQVADANTNNNLVEGNYVGTTLNGNAALANGSDGILINNGAQNNTVGGTSANARNLSSGNAAHGIQVADANTKNNVVEGNYVGTDVNGGVALPNTIDGIIVNNGAQNNTVGGSTSGAGNLSSGNTFAGVQIADSGTNLNTVAGNLIGTDATGLLALGNTGPGVDISNGAQSNQIGGSTALANVIAFNKAPGVVVINSTTTGNSIRANSIHDNTGLGIDLGWDGVTQNHRNGGATGPNIFENFPFIKSATPGTTTSVSGDYNSLPNTVYTLDFYANPTRDLSFYGQGQTYLGSTTVTTDASGNATFNATLSTATSAGQWIAATATDPSGNTSEFSVARPLPVNDYPVPLTWKPIGPAPVLWGPFAGRITNAVPDPNNSNIMYVSGEDGGVWKTTDWTDPNPSWTPLTDSQPSLSIGPHDLVVYPGNTQIIYAAASAPSGRILESTDGGTTWTALGKTPFDGATLSSLVIDPKNSSNLFVAVSAGTNPGVFKSTDGGQNWTNVTSGIISGTATDLVMDPSNATTLYAGFAGASGSSNGIWKTTNGGTSWSHLTNGVPTAPSFGSIRLAISPSTTSDLYATIYDGNADTTTRYKTTDGGNSWTTLTALPNQERFRILLAVDPSNPLIVYANGDHNLFQSIDGGTTWTQIAPGTLINSNVDPQGGYFDDSGAFVLGDDDGVYRWAGGTNHFERKQGNLQVTQFFNLALDPTSPDYAYGIAIDFPAVLKYYGEPVWNQQASSSEFGILLVNPTQPNTVYYYGGSVSGEGGSGTYSFFRSDDAGTTFVAKNTGLTLTEASSQTALAEDPASPARLLLGTTRVYETTNGGDSWTALAATPASGGATVTHLAISATHSSTVYASTSDGKFFVSTNDGSTWLEKDQSLKPSVVTSIQLNPKNDQQLFVTAGTDVWESVNGGTTWTRITGSLPGFNTNTIAVDWRGPTPVLYVGTDRNAYWSPDLGKTWSVFGTGLPNTKVTDLVFLQQVDLLAAATYGRGVFDIAIPGPATHFSVSAPATATAGTSFSITVTALDASNLVANAYTGTVKFTSSDSKAVLPVNYTFTSADNGQHVFTVTLKTAGNQTITATDTKTSTITGSQTVTANPAAISKFLVSGFPSPITAGTSGNFTVTASDAYGNTVPTYTGTVKFSSSDHKAALPANYMFTSTDMGKHTFSATLKTAGTQSITATDTVTSTIKGTQSGIKVNPAAASKLSVTGFPTSVVHGTAHNFTVTVLDAFGNVVTGYVGTITFTSSDSKASFTPTTYTFTSADKGKHTFSATLNTVGTQSITATDTNNSSITGSETGIKVTSAKDAPTDDGDEDAQPQRRLPDQDPDVWDTLFAGGADFEPDGGTVLDPMAVDGVYLDASNFGGTESPEANGSGPWMANGLSLALIAASGLVTQNIRQRSERRPATSAR